MIAAVVVTYSAPAETLDRCLRALLDTEGLDRIVVVDTGGSAVVAPDLAGTVELHPTDNRGYGAAANAGRQLLAGADAIALLNDDVVVQPGWLAPLVAALADDRVGAVQPILVGVDHSLVASAGVELDRFGAGTDIGDGASPPSGEPGAIKIFNGGTVLFDTDFLDDVGGFDERYFLYYEDVDLALRGTERGWTYLLVPASVVEHRRGTTTATMADLTRFYQERNRLWAVVRFATVPTIGRAFWLSVRRLRHRPRGVHRRALIAGAGGVPRRLIERFRAPGTRTAHR
ncbi:MAG: glycosyltransferase family 2 protein [Ilumatobacteraceae bacterium]